jgi:hypothetical protein
MVRRRRHWAIVLVAALVLGACSGPAKKVDPVADLVLAKKALPSAADLPGYSETPAKTVSAIPAAAKRDFARCLKADVTLFDDVPGAQKVASPAFSKEGASLSSSVAVEPKTRDVGKLWNELTSALIEPCLQRFFSGALDAAVRPSTFGFDTNVTRFTVGVGNRSIGYASRISSRGDNAAFYVDLVFVARGRSAIQVMTFADGKPFDRAREIAVARAIYDRIGTNAS